MQRYDRQIRLWSESGQTSLKNAKLLVVGKSLTISELVKNLTLAGIGEITTLDADGTPTSSVYPVYGDIRAFNSQVSIKNTLPTDVDLIVIAHGCTVYERWLEYGVPIIIAAASLMEGYVGIETGSRSLFVLQPHPPGGLFDLRFGKVWPELQEFCNSFDLGSMSDIDHSRIPYAILLLKAQESGGKIEDVKMRLAKMKRFSHEENFNEALKNTSKLCQQAVPDGVKELICIYDSDRIPSSEKATEPFWQHIAALKKFVAVNAQLPLSGDIPDMFSSSINYTKLQEIYRRKHREDLEELKSYLPSLQDESFTATFCRNSRYIQVILPSSYSSNKPMIWNSEYIFSAGADMRELMPISAVIGGIAAQEASKLLMRQYTPLVSMLKYNAVDNKTAVFKCGATTIN